MVMKFDNKFDNQLVWHWTWNFVVLLIVEFVIDVRAYGIGMALSHNVFFKKRAAVRVILHLAVLFMNLTYICIVICDM